MVHILPHWNWENQDDSGCKGHCRARRFRGGLEIEVWTYTNGDVVELFLNGASLGKQDVPIEPGTEHKCRHNMWKVRRRVCVLDLTTLSFYLIRHRRHHR